MSVILWRCDFGSCPTTVAFATAGVPGSADSADDGATHPATRNGVLSVQVTDIAAERTAIEGVLGRFTKRWKLDRMEPAGEGGALVRYRVRLRKSAQPDTIVHEVVTRGGGAVAAAAFDALPPTG